MSPTPFAGTRRAPARAFTLIELLTVIAIIGILASIIIPTVSKVRDTAKTSACASNLRQLAGACLLYANENRNRMIPIQVSSGTDQGKTWRILIEPYIGSRRSGANVLICPGDSITEYPVSSATGEWPPSYGLNAATNFNSQGTLLEYPGSKAASSQNITAIKQPSRFIMMADIGKGTGSTSDPTNWTEVRHDQSPSAGFARFPWDGVFNPGDWSVWPRHGSKRKANAAFYDGHVASVDLLADLKAHPNGDPLCLFDNH